jgi:hypothetical protein
MLAAAAAAGFFSAAVRLRLGTSSRVDSFIGRRLSDFALCSADAREPYRRYTPACVQGQAAEAEAAEAEAAAAGCQTLRCAQQRPGTRTEDTHLRICTDIQKGSSRLSDLLLCSAEAREPYNICTPAYEQTERQQQQRRRRQQQQQQ